jgi:DegV family protein with EDD domain
MSARKIVILTDSSAHISSEIQEELKIVVIPLWLIWDGESMQDGIDIQPQAFYQKLKGSKTLPTSSQPSAQEFKTLFEQIGKDADSIVAILVSSRISGTITSAQMAADELPGLDIRILDTLTCAMGLGLIVMAAARAAAENRSVDEVVVIAEKMRQSVYTLFVVDTLDYLFKGGRISGGKHLLGTALNIKPILHFHEGQIKPLTQARSKKKALAQLLDIVEERLGDGQMLEAVVMDVDAATEGDQFAEMIRARFNPTRLGRAGVSPVVGTHVGPGTVGISFYPVLEK